MATSTRLPMAIGVTAQSLAPPATIRSMVLPKTARVTKSTAQSSATLCR